MSGLMDVSLSGQKEWITTRGKAMDHYQGKSNGSLRGERMDHYQGKRNGSLPVEKEWITTRG